MIEQNKLLKHRKLLLVLPLITLPFLTLMFWALGGGSAQGQDKDVVQIKGVNITLPDASLDDAGLDKMAYYDKAMQDSVKSGLHDGYIDPLQDSGTGQVGSLPDPTMVSNMNAYPGYGSSGGGTSSREAQIQQRLAQLNETLSQDQHASKSVGNTPTGRQAAQSAGDLDRLEQMMQMMSQPTEDPEMQQLDGMLNKIMDIQNPGRVQEEMRRRSAEKRGQVFAVSAASTTNIVSSLEKQNGSNKLGNGFYSLEEPAIVDTQNAIKAVVHESQTVTNGASIRLRLVNDIYVNGVLIPRDNFLIGAVTLNGERLVVRIASIRFKNSIFPVDLTVYDMDGMEGVHVPGAIGRDVAKNSADQGLQGFGIGNMNPSLGVQAASVGIEAAKGFLSKKVKLIRVTVKAGYQVLLRDEQQKQ